jgi:hypothetical protein
MISKLDGRVRKLEREARPQGLRAAIQVFVARDENKYRPGALNPNNPILQQGVDDNFRSRGRKEKFPFFLKAGRSSKM